MGIKFGGGGAGKDGRDGREGPEGKPGEPGRPGEPGKDAQRPYKSAVFLISQLGEDPPSLIELENDTGATFSTLRERPGVYLLIASSRIFTRDKTVAFISCTEGETPAIRPFKSDALMILVLAMDEAADGFLNNSMLELRVYP